MGGHKRLSTMDKYLRPSRRAAEKALSGVAAVAGTLGPPSSAQAGETAAILAPLWHPPGSSGRVSEHDDREKPGVTDGFRTRDIWSHNRGFGAPRSGKTRRIVPIGGRGEIRVRYSACTRSCRR